VVVSGGVPAIALLEADADWDVLICDLMMPDLDGAAVYTWVQEHRPALASRMVFCSGGAFTPRGVAFLDQVGERLLQKPVRPADLRAAVARVLRLQS
jgi:CheY-like chemotaxis protein